MVYEAYDSLKSENHLSHYGIIGMKWGIRRFQNPDGTLTSEGRERYYGKGETDKFAKDLRNYKAIGYSGLVNNYARISNTVQMKSIASNMRRLWEEAKGFRKKTDQTENNFFKRKDFSKWVRKAAEADWKEENKDGELEKEGWTFDSFLDWYMYDDGDQGLRTTRSFDLWLKNSGEKEAKEYLKNEQKAIDAHKKYDSECKKAVQAFMGEHGDETYEIKSYYGNNTFKRDVADRGVDIVTRIMNSWDTFSDDFNGQVPLETYMKLIN